MTVISSPNDTIRVDVKGAVCWITLNRPKALNALNDDLSVAFAHVIRELGSASGIRAVVLQGEGDHFMAGGDIKTFHAMLSETSDPAEIKARFSELIENFHAAMLNLRHLDQPVLASVKGAAAGAGVSLMLACDLVLAADDSFFTLAYCHLGVSPDGGSTHHLPRAVGMKRALEIALLGDRFDAETAAAWGLVNRVVPAGNLAAETEKLAGRLAFGPGRAHAGAKKLLYASLGNSFEEQLAREARSFADCTATDDFREGVEAFVNKRKPEFKGE